MISRFRQNFPFLYPQTKQINIDLSAHGAREVINKHKLAFIEFYRKAIKHNNNSTFSPVFPQGNIGERPKERQFLRRGVEKDRLFVHSSQQREERTKKRRRSYRAFWLVATVAVGELRNSLRSNSPRPFPSVSLASSPPDKGGIGDCYCRCFLTPPSFGHLPYILRCKTQGRSFKISPIK